MKNILIIIACIPLIILMSCIVAIGYTAFAWVPFVLQHWAGFIIGSFVTLATSIIVSGFFEKHNC